MDDQKQAVMTKSQYTTLIVGVVCLLIGIAIGWTLLTRGTQAADIKMKFGNNELSIDLKQDLKTGDVILEKLFSTKFSTDGTLGWLEDNQELYKPNDSAIVRHIANLDYDAVVCDALRKLSKSRDSGPWAYQFDTVRISFPPKQPSAGYANVCENKKYLGKNLRIYSLDQMRSIEVKATGRYECPKGLTFPDIQLNKEDARELLGYETLPAVKEGVALILTEK